MAMTLGFDVFGTLERTFDKTKTLALLMAIAKHAPKPPLRVARQVDGGYVITELADNDERACGDAEAIVAAINVASSVTWPSADAPANIEPFIVPGKGWDLGAIRAEPALSSKGARYHLAGSCMQSSVARRMLGARSHAVLGVAEKHGLLLIYR